ncbi:WD40-repeat-containing domain protein [Fusarium flagelliforme]|uniref:WD40-repeat-containing domain protein n=1 Tax=Fusarium flagelliforme TaxID=2675880 RepID=UPI001E8DBBB3|nr:WD40-repeat-containing domain protein [Fusarium flagelliforme]KAH7198297.1 WD40-repeat-containing domain protein [Fusarium flagelliforme]
MEQNEPASIRKRHLIIRSFDSLPIFQEVVFSVLCLVQPVSVSSLSTLLDIPEDTIFEQINILRPIVDIPQDVHEPLSSLPIKFKEFMFDPDYEYNIDPALVHDNLATSCLLVMYKYLKPNICGLSSPGQDRSTIPMEKISSCIPEVLIYACTNWVAHLQASETATGNIMNPFLEGYLLRWLEELEFNHQLSLVQSALKLLYRNMSIIDSNPLQLYSSVIMFAPYDASAIGLSIWARPRWITLRMKEVPEDCSRQISEGHDSVPKDEFRGIEAVALSPDQSIIASAGLAGSIKLWDFRNEQMIQETRTIGCGLLHVGEFEFSPDGNLLLVLGHSSGSVAWIWSVKYGRYVHDFTEQEWTANTAVFSRDSKTIIIGCDDNVVRRWSTNTYYGFVNELMGHGSALCVVAVSPVSDLFASGDYDGIVWLWDASGSDVTSLHKLKGPDAPVVGAVFSPNGQHLAVSHEDNTIYIWDNAVGNCLKTLTVTDAIGSVAFSRNSLLAVSTRDNNVQLWSTEDDTCLQSCNFPHVGTCKIEFDPSGSQIIFDAGQLSIQALDDEGSGPKLVDTGFALSKDTRWRVYGRTWLHFRMGDSLGVWGYATTT